MSDALSAQERAVWPAGLELTDQGLSIEGVAISELAERFGTPLYVIDENDFRARAATVRRALAEAGAAHGVSVGVYYAGKALLTAAIARWVSEAGLGIDVASGGELAIALAGGADPSQIGLHGNNKSDQEISSAIDAQVGCIVLDSAEEITRVAEAAAWRGRRQPVRLRVNSGVHAGGHEYLATAHEDQKFGVPLAEAAALIGEINRHDHLQYLGLHCHIGSQIFGADGFAESATRLLDIYAQPGCSAPELNLGGGFGVAYTPEDQPTPIDEFAAAIVDAVVARASQLTIPVPKLVFEPGRYIAAPAGLTIYSVGATKSVPLEEGRQRRYVSVDGGMSDNLRPALYGARYTVRLASRCSAAPAVLSRLAGKHCESGDILIDEAWLPGDVGRGDVVAVATTGAYCYAMSNNYNALTRPALVAVASGSARELVRRETIADVLSRDYDANNPGASA